MLKGAAPGARGESCGDGHTPHDDARCAPHGSSEGRAHERRRAAHEGRHHARRRTASPVCAWASPGWRRTAPAGARGHPHALRLRGAANPALLRRRRWLLRIHTGAMRPQGVSTPRTFGRRWWAWTTRAARAPRAEQSVPRVLPPRRLVPARSSGSSWGAMREEACRACGSATAHARACDTNVTAGCLPCSVWPLMPSCAQHAVSR